MFCGDVKKLKCGEKKLSLKGGSLGTPMMVSLIHIQDLPFFPSQWNNVLLQLKERVENYSEIKFNSVLLNEYPNGEVGMGWHSDDEKELGTDPIIASLSFGANRDFIFKHKTDKSIENVKLHLKRRFVVAYAR